MPFSVLLTALAEIRDPRRPQGRRYALAPLLLFSVLAVLAGATSYQGIITFIDVQRERLNTEFGVCFRRAPALNTSRNLFLALAPADLEAAFRRHARHQDQRIGAEGWRTVSFMIFGCACLVGPGGVFAYDIQRASEKWPREISPVEFRPVQSKILILRT